MKYNLSFKFYNQTEEEEVMEKVESAKKYFEKGFQCSQAVFAAYATECGLTEEQALKIGAAFGGGMCKGEVCGAVTGALMAIGLKYGQCVEGDVDSKVKTNELTCLMMDKFKEENGSYICKDLLGYDLSIKEEAQQARELGLFTSFCPKMVESAARIVGEMF